MAFFTSSGKAVLVILSSLKFSDKNFGFSTAYNLHIKRKLKSRKPLLGKSGAAAQYRLRR